LCVRSGGDGSTCVLSYQENLKVEVLLPKAI
jgi:hypothetical protein